jgi:hypothetical protein
MKKLLIYVPTYNGGKRLEYFIDRFIKVSKGLESDIDLHISDNCSDIFSPPIGIENIKYSINSKNIGLSRNFNKVYGVNSNYEYTWILGDDDYILDGSLSRLLNILNKYNPKFLFLNTVSYDASFESSVMAEFNNSGDLPVANAVLKSLINEGDIIHTNFAGLINPKVDDVLLGSIMCGVFKSSEVKDFSSDKFDDDNKLNVFSSYPHVINYANSFSADSYSIFDPFAHTFNFWNGGNTWRNEYDQVVGLSLLYSIRIFYEKNLITPEVERELIKHYFFIGGKSLSNILTDSNWSDFSHVSAVLPYLIKAINRLKMFQ